MAEIINMPKLSDTMTEGVVAEWHKKVGDTVKSGELLAEIETDKATLEFESFFDGVLLHIGIEKGKPAPVNSLLAIIGEKGEDISGLLKGEAPAEDKKEVQKDEKKTDAEPAKKEEAKAEEKSAPTETKKTEAPKPQAVSNNSNTRILASPLAKKLAEEKGVDLNFIAGTGEGGRITKRDVDHYVPYDAPERPAGSGSAAMSESFTDEPVSQMRKTIARRLGESKFSAPHFYLTISLDMDNAIAARKSMNSNEGVKVSFNDMVIKAVAMSLRKHPAINSSWLGDVIRRNNHVHIGVAVAVDEGLLVPVIRFADSKGLSQIGDEVKVLAQKAKDKKLQPAEWEGNTFTVSNLGMFGIEQFTAIINSPDSCIMAIGGISQVPVVKNGQVVPGNIMKVTLSCDHRTVDGATGAAFLQTFKQYMENPVMMLV
ncbi:MAG: pyruvate dehydrogenase complex dihydrolipoamide acetyltransferase [Fluviicola sp.]|jgi:pyruvate dehydrogenase E2 component (dihydrolipoamide acetyltransferase)|uniref:pyruvate dehydrogenase complex dihydrolipoamide acetyltransferase n=1 Tax=Fluviicola sp. TaxID=1917219 RepID=UPI002603F2AF|nr:pyruvate dehydrogenase complex dihydrolipoamide acetyltransferase [Fluviicola sp.]MDF3028876.1 pyruvate dehydrogenase complex dihydrolipoamide acetyltransferase [Fluviicola sp.]